MKKKRLYITLTIIVLNISQFLFACSMLLVDYDFFHNMHAIRKNDTIEIDLGTPSSSILWVNVDHKIKDDIIYVRGERTETKKPWIYSIKLPDEKKQYKLFWVDADGENEISLK